MEYLTSTIRKNQNKVRKCATLITQLPIHLKFLYDSLDLNLFICSWLIRKELKIPYSLYFNDILTLEEPPMIPGITHRKIVFGILIRTKSFLYNYNLPERSDEIFQKTIPYDCMTLWTRNESQCRLSKRIYLYYYIISIHNMNVSTLGSTLA